jgi:hypothetical protein
MWDFNHPVRKPADTPPPKKEEGKFSLFKVYFGLQKLVATRNFSSRPGELVPGIGKYPD